MLPLLRPRPRPAPAIALQALVTELEAVVQAAGAATPPPPYLMQIAAVLRTEGAHIVHAIDCHGTAAIHYAAALPDEAATAQLLLVAVSSALAEGRATGVVAPGLDHFLALTDPQVGVRAKRNRDHGRATGC